MMRQGYCNASDYAGATSNQKKPAKFKSDKLCTEIKKYTASLILRPWVKLGKITCCFALLLARKIATEKKGVIIAGVE